ncbi:MAG TPA: thiamine-phosphate kinase [Gammaproteobacteria bacterium]|nr:thiamine-phosphate kinase [Gammaproteobacteria bacterium]
MDEFDLIARILQHFVEAPQLGVVLGPGDDAALLQPTPGSRLVVSTDMLLSGVHFPTDTGPQDIAYKALMVNLSDLAAMGATPRWYTVSLALPRADEACIDSFCAGLLQASRPSGIALVGGDITCGSLSVAITIMGECPDDSAMLRSAACVGDDIYLTGTIGDAALGLQILQGRLQAQREDRRCCIERLQRPQARNRAGLAIRSLAHAAIDISDGLLQDLGHVARASGLQAVVYGHQLPLSDSYQRLVPATTGLVPAISFGDDYELCFTAAAVNRQHIESVFTEIQLPCTRIGTMQAGKGIVFLDHKGRAISTNAKGYQHFMSQG